VVARQGRPPRVAVPLGAGLGAAPPLGLSLPLPCPCPWRPLSPLPSSRCFPSVAPGPRLVVSCSCSCSQSVKRTARAQVLALRTAQQKEREATEQG